MRPKGPVLTALALAPFIATSALAADPPDPAALRSLGLDGLHWGMSAEEASKVMPGLKTGPGGLEKPLHSFEGCKSRLELAFTAGKLSQIVMIPDADVYSCRVNVADYISATYGQTNDVVQGTNDWIFRWKGPTAIVFTTTVLENLFKGRLELFDNRP